jgi:hypothetical protein
VSTPTQKRRLRDSISGYCRSAVFNEPRIHYSQARPFPFVDLIGVGWHTLDCSGFVINCFWNAGHDTAIYLRDPSGQKFSGYGNTWTMETWLRENGKRIVGQPFLIGDVALYHGHVTVCSKRGTAYTSDWTSHGSEGGPVVVKLRYRDDLVGVWRHPVLL